MVYLAPIKNKILCLFILFFSFFFNEKSYSQWDYSSSLALQSYPYGGALAGTLGRGIRLNELSYLRPFVKAQTSLLLNSLEGTFEIFPLPILGFYGSLTGTRNYSKVYEGIDCNQVKCRGRFFSKTLGTKGAIPFWDYFIVLDYSEEYLKSDDPSYRFLHPESGLIASPKMDTLRQLDVILGGEIKDNSHFKKKYGVFSSYYSMKRSRQKEFISMGYFSIEDGDLNYSVLLGNNHGPYGVNHLTSMFFIKWTGQKSIGFL